ncbi:MAG: APC family permease [Gemmatimonadaceae bacterium]|nr:APC family permease [Gemmatimonadaceae bacterium]
MSVPVTRTLGTAGLVFVMYFQVSGGPYTTEALVASVGPGMALLVLALLPLVWAVPEALLIGELASMLPEEGGYYAWVKRAFGGFWGFQNAWITWCYSLVDMALYPIFFTTYLAWFVPGLTETQQWIAALAMIWTATALNLAGARGVGRAATVIGVLVLGAFATMALGALPHWQHVPWQPFVKPGESALGSLGVACSLALWNYIGWDNASTVGGEVRDAGRTYPRALAITVPLVAGVYLLSLLPALGATDWTTWREGGWPEIARAAVGGPVGAVLAPWIAAAGMASAFAFFTAYLMTYSRLPMVVAADGLLPRALTRTDARGTPRVAVVGSAVVYSVFALFPLGSLVVADVLLYAMAVALEFAALIALRRREPALRGAFRLPVGTVGVVALALLPMITIAVIIGLAVHDGELGLPAALAAGLAIALGPVVWRISSRSLGTRRASDASEAGRR